MWRRVLIIFGYVLVTILIVGVTAALVAYGKGYTYDLGSGRIIQKGYVIINSSPSGIRVWEGSKQLGKKTPYQAAYKTGRHTFRLERDGLWSWQKTLEVVAGQVSLARYAILVPKIPKSTVLDTRAQIVAQSISRDHRHLAYVTGGVEAALYTMDLSNSKVVRLYVPKAATETEPAEVLTDVMWSDDASHLLIASTMGSAPVHRLAAAAGGEPTNLTQQYGFTFSGLKFSGNNWRQLYWISPDGLRRLDVESQSVSAVLADKVTQILTTPDRVLYVQQTDLGRSLWSLDGRGHHQELVPALAESDSYSLAFGNYNNQDVLAVVPAKTRRGTLYTDIYGNTPVAKTIAHDVTAASFSPDGHFVVFSSPTVLQTYDLERSSLENKLVLYTITDQPGELAALSWFDKFHLLLTRGGHLYWSEYDGANRVDLGPAAGAFPGYGSSDFKSVNVFRPEGQNIRLTNLLIKP